MLSKIVTGLNIGVAPKLRASHVSTVNVRTIFSAFLNKEKPAMKIKTLPALKDNYMYLIVDSKTNEAGIVDPVAPNVVLIAANEANSKLTKVLTTHHHLDHAGGNEDLLKMYTHPLKVYGGDDRISALSHKVKDGTTLKIGALDVRCISTPCHTTGHMCYYVESPNGERAVFTGDTLFQGGCGRFAEGTAEEMYCALCQKLSSLPDDTKVFCGHEYTLQNMAFARRVEPNNEALLERITWAKAQRAKDQPTVPSTIGQEKQWNPFMRVNELEVQKYVEQSNPISTMRKLRSEKDRFNLVK